VQEGDNPVDLSIENRGESDARLPATVTVTWSGAHLMAADALPGWEVQTREERAEFKTLPSQPLRIAPGERIQIGWLRLDPPVKVDAVLQVTNEASP